MLAKICEGIPDALAQLGGTDSSFLAEYKYDGQRAQIHMLPDGQVRSRILEGTGLVDGDDSNLKAHQRSFLGWDRYMHIS